MKTLVKTLAVILLLVNICSANELSYKLNIENLTYTSERTLEFDIYLLNTSESKSNQFNYSLGQYFLEFNPGIANGGTLTYSIVSSALPEAMRPRNPSVFGNQLRLACNHIGSKDNLPVIHFESPGLLVVKMRLETSADKFSKETLNLKWTDKSSKFKTKIFSFVENKNVEIRNSGNATVDNLDPNGTGAEKFSTLPTEYSLSQNYPNPFNPATTINYELPGSSLVTLKVYDISGKEVATLVNEQLNAGSYKVSFNGNNFSSGIYFYRLIAGTYSKTIKMLLIK